MHKMTLAGACCWFIRDGSVVQVHARQENGKARPAVSRRHAAAHANGPTVLLDDAVGYPEPQTGALFSFGCKERLKQAAAVFGSDTAAIIGNGDAYAAALRI